MPVVPRARAAAALVVLSSVLAAARLFAACAGVGAGASYAAGPAPQMLATGDFDGDGVADLAVACQTGASLAVLRGLGGGAFGAPAYYASGTGARALAVSDLNGDGSADIAVCVGTGIAVWLGDGHGGFSGGAIVPAGASPAGLAFGDFDADGIMDLAVASGGTASVLVLRGQGADGVGNGTFGAPLAYAVGASPARLVAADLDGDGILDLAVANNGGASVSVLRGLGGAGRGNGAFAAAITVPVAGSPWALAALDWNLDGVPDLVVGNGAGAFLTLLRGTGGCAFANAGTVPTPTAPRDLVAGDFDGDGVPDLAVACAVANTVCVLRGTGGGFATLATVATPAGATGLAGGDWNGDGVPDLASANAGGASVTRFLGTCPAAPTAAVTLLAPLGGESWWPGTPQQVRWARGAGVLAVDVELSRDGGHAWTAIAHGLTSDHMDLLAVGTPDPSLRVRVRDALVPSRAASSPGDVTLCSVLAAPIASDAGLAATCLARGDVDGDGLPDLVAADAAQVRVLRGDGHGHFAAISTGFAASGTRQLLLADIHGGGVPDLVRASATGVGVRRGDGAGGFGPETLLVAGDVTAIEARDLDGDGLADVVALAADGAGARLLAWRSSAPGAPWSAPVSGAPQALACGDFDGDGLADLAVGAGGGVQLWYGRGAAARGDGSFAPGPAQSLPSAPGEIAVMDVDGDGTPDVLACLPASGDLVRLPLAPAGAEVGLPGFATLEVVSAGAPPRVPAGADLDGDGRADAVAVLAGENTLAVFRGTASGFAPPVRFAAGSCAAAIEIDDFTGDGNPDVVVATADGRVLCLPAQCPPQLEASLALAAPGDSTTACAGFTRTIAWTRSASVPAVRIELSRDGGTHWSTLADGVVTNRFTWVVAGPPAAAARVRVCDATCATRFDAGARFAIRAPFATPGAGDGLPSACAFAIADAGRRPDAVLCDGRTVQVLHADAAGTFTESTHWSEAGVRRARLADLDGDGVPELLTLHANSVMLRRGLAGGAFGPAATLWVEDGAADIVVGDFDEDGVPDLAIASGSGAANRVAVRLGTGPDAAGVPAFGPAVLTALPGMPTALAAADVDGDGVLDLLVAHAGGLAVLRGSGSGGRGDGGFRVASARAFGMGDVSALHIADLDGDGRADVLAADSAASALLVAAGDGAGGFASPVSIATAAAPLGVELADVDRDGTPDVVASLANGDVELLRGVAGAPMASRFAAAGRIAAGNAGGELLLRDADGDGVADAIVAGADGHVRVARGLLAPAGPPRLAGGPPANAPLGTERVLTWSRPAGVTRVDVELSRDDGVHWSPIATSLGGTSWRWTVTGPLTGAARLRVRDASVAAATDSASARFAIDPYVTGVAPPAPRQEVLGAPWPNPSPGEVALSLALHERARVRVEVYDVGGRRVATLADRVFAAGTSALRWNGRDDAGAVVPAGLYFVRARGPGLAAVRRLVRL